MDQFSKPAAAQLNSVFAPQQQQIAAQIPAIQQLYQSLVQGLTGLQDTQTQGILASAEQRGVSRAGLEGDLMASLGGAVGLEGARLGVQQSGDLAQTGGNLQQLGLERVNSVSSLAKALQDRSLTNKQAKLRATDTRRSYNLAIQKAQRDDELARLAAAQAAAQAASYGYDGGSTSTGTTPEQKEASPYKVFGSELKRLTGRDGYVSPTTYYQGLHAWQSLGGTRASFNDRFARYRNPADAKKGFYTGKGF